ncbi:unnamed protein product, partial [Rotaria sordida]
ASQETTNCCIIEDAPSTNQQIIININNQHSIDPTIRDSISSKR